MTTEFDYDNDGLIEFSVLPKTATIAADLNRSTWNGKLDLLDQADFSLIEGAAPEQIAADAIAVFNGLAARHFDRLGWTQEKPAVLPNGTVSPAPDLKGQVYQIPVRISWSYMEALVEVPA